MNRTPAEIVRRDIWEVFPEAVGSVFQRQFTLALESKQVVEFEDYFGFTDRWYMIKAYPAEDGLTIYFHDATGHHASDEALENVLRLSERQRRLAAVLAETNEAVFRAKTTGELFSSAVRIAVEHGGMVMAWIGVADRSRGEIVLVASAGESAAEYLNRVRISLDYGDTGQGVGGIAFRTGTDVCSNDILIDENMAPWRDAAVKAGYRSSGAFPLFVGGHVAGLLSVYVAEPDYFNEEERSMVRRLAANVSYGWESLLREGALRESDVARRTGRRFRAVLSAVPDAVIGVDSNGLVELVNGQAERLFGWTSDELIGRTVEELVPHDMRETHTRLRRAFIDDDVRRYRDAMQISAQRKDGTTFPAEIALSSVVVDEGHFLVLASVRDLTERLEIESERRQMALEAQREQTDRLESLGKLAGGVAHDFNNLLGVVLNYATLLERQKLEPQVEADVREIRAAAQRGADLTRQLLTFARGGEGNPEPIDAGASVRNLSALLERALGPGVTLRIATDDRPLVVRMDRQQLDQIILNLAINSNDAMPEGGVVTISAELYRTPIDVELPRDSAAVRLRVADTGTGMPPEVASRIFEPFYTTKARGRGTGLGMAVVYGIVSRSGGRVSVDSEVGKGTTITVDLPAIDADALVDEDFSAHPSLRSSGGTEGVLVVEDDPRLREATARIIAEAGYRVFSASDGREALKMIETQETAIDLVLSDMVMPNMGGDELADILAERTPPMKVLLMTGYDSGEHVVRENVLLKPVDDRRLLSALRQVLDG